MTGPACKENDHRILSFSPSQLKGTKTAISPTFGFRLPNYTPLLVALGSGSGTLNRTCEALNGESSPPSASL